MEEGKALFPRGQVPPDLKPSRLPTFIIGGAAKAGTTSLWHDLRAHPDVGMPEFKEPKFLTRQRGRNRGAPEPAPPGSSNFNRGWGWYTGLFAPHEHKLARGEASTMYLNAPDAPAMMAAVVPWIKLVFCLRHPVDRIYSHYWYERCYEKLPSFEELARSGHPRLIWYKNQSHYARHLARYRSFGLDQILVVLSEDLADEREKTLEHVCDFIGVSSARLPTPEDVRHNTASETRWPSLHRMLAYHRRDWARPFPDFALGPARRVKNFILDRNTLPARHPPMPDDLRAALVDEFADDIRYVEECTGRALPSWRR